MKKEKLSKIIKIARENKKLSQRELSRRTNIDNGEISRIEKGTRIKPGVMVLKKLAKELNLDIVMLMEICDYDDEEIEMCGICGANYREEITSIAASRIEDYLRKKGNVTYMDIIKTLKGYKKGDIDEAQVLAHIMIATGVDMTKYLLPDQKKYLKEFEPVITKYDDV